MKHGIYPEVNEVWSVYVNGQLISTDIGLWDAIDVFIDLTNDDVVIHSAK